MSHLGRRLATLLTGSLIFGLLALSAPAQADTMLDLVREIGAQPTANGASAVTSRRRCVARKRHGRGAKAGGKRASSLGPRRARLGRKASRVRLTAAQRGSGRIDRIGLDDGAGPISLDDRPAIQAKAGF